jgi:hypothetical protein
MSCSEIARELEELKIIVKWLRNLLVVRGTSEGAYKGLTQGECRSTVELLDDRLKNANLEI